MFLHIKYIFTQNSRASGKKETIPSVDASKYYISANDGKEEDKDEAVESVAETLEGTHLENQEDVEELPPEEPTGDKTENEYPEVDPDEFLRKVFLYALRFHLPKDLKLPIDVGQFYATVILKALPEGQKIDMKKTKYKKFSNFLSQINESAGEGNWFVKVLSRKNIDSIVEVWLVFALVFYKLPF